MTTSAVPQPLVRQSRTHLEALVTALDVEFLGLAECLVSPGWRLELGGPLPGLRLELGPPMPAIHYCLAGAGFLRIEGQDPMPVKHTLMVMPQGLRFQIKAVNGGAAAGPDTTLIGRDQIFPPGAIRRYTAGAGPYQMILICGYFRARYAANLELFSGNAVGTSAGLLAPYIMGSVIEKAATPLDGFNTGYVICGIIMLIGGIVGVSDRSVTGSR